MEEINLLIVDDHPGLSDGYKGWLERPCHSYKFIVAQAFWGNDAITLAKTTSYKIILMDYQLPDMNGCEVMRQIFEFNNDVKIIGMSGFNEYWIVNYMCKAGAKGFISKMIHPDDMIHGIDEVINGREYYSNDIKDLKIQHETPGAYPDESEWHITKKEKEVLELSIAHLNNKVIAEILKVDIGTVERHISNLKHKFRAKTHDDLLRFGTIYLKTGRYNNPGSLA